MARKVLSKILVEEPIPEIQAELEECLSEHDVLVLEHNALKAERIKLSKEILALKMHQYKLMSHIREQEVKILELETEKVTKLKREDIQAMSRASEKLSEEVVLKDGELSLVRDENSQTVTALKQKYQITSENIGYNPDTRKIARD